MKLLYLRHCYLYPRFHQTVIDCLDAPPSKASHALEKINDTDSEDDCSSSESSSDPEPEESVNNVSEFYVPLTKSMKDIQAAILDCIQQCLDEFKRANPYLEIEDLTIDNSMYKSFDAILRSLLDPVWHKTSAKTKQLVSDLGVLRDLLR